MKEPNISIYFFFPPITVWCSISNVLFTGGRGMSDFSVLKYYQLNINYLVNILNECLRILIDCSQFSKTYYNVLFSSSTRDHHARQNLPWLTGYLRRRNKRKHRMYKKCKARGSPEAKAEFKKETAREQMRARWKFVNNIVNKALEDNNSRPFWKYV